MFARYLRPGFCLVAILSVVTGLAYPFLITAVAGAAFPSQAGGSLIFRGPVLIGSRLIGQNFSDPKYFWGRPSATLPQPYNGLASGGSNLGPTNPALLDEVAARVKSLRDADPDDRELIPVELVAASASGLDPDLSPAAAAYQSLRIARARGLAPAAIKSLIAQHRREPLLGVFGEPTVNVLELNLALDQLR